MKTNLLNLAKEFGTPLYVYDSRVMLNRLEQIRKAFPVKNLKVLFAMKANYCPALLKILKANNAGVDLVSPGDYELAKACGFDNEDLLYTVNNISDSEMHEMHEQGVLFNIDSLSRLKKFAEAFPKSKVCLRFNPNVVAGGNEKIQTGGKISKFGLRLYELDEILKIIKSADLKVVGLHKHTGSEIREAKDFMSGAEALLNLAKPEQFPDLEFLDFGGGLGVPYRPEEKHIDLNSLSAALLPRFYDLCEIYKKDLGLYFEPGKFLVAECGTLLTEVNTIKTTNEYNFVGTDSGFTQLIRPVLYEAYHPIKNLNNPEAPKLTYEVCGNICETGDWFARGRELPEISEGDILAIENAGAYCYSMASLYNLRALPAEVVISEENGEEVVKLARKRETSKELINSILNQCV